MSYYQHQGPVQGGGYGALDDEQRKRRKHFRDAGAPYSGGISQPPSQQPLTTGGGPASAVPTYDVRVQQPQPLAAPRMGAAVDLGQGPVQQASEADIARKFAPAYDPHQMISRGSPDPEQHGQYGGFDLRAATPVAPERDQPSAMEVDSVSLQKSLSTAHDFPDVDKPAPSRQQPHSVSLQKSLSTAYDFPDVDKPAPSSAPTAARVVGSGGMSKMPGYGDPYAEPQPRRPQRDPRPPPVAPPQGPRAPIVRPRPGLPQMPKFKPPSGHFAPVRTRIRQAPHIDQDDEKHAFAPAEPHRPRARGFGPARTAGAGRGRRPPGDPYSKPPPWGPGPKKPKGALRNADWIPDHVHWGPNRTKRFRGDKYTPGRIVDWQPTERERHQGYRQLGQHQGREMARREHDMVTDKLHRRNKDLLSQVHAGQSKMGQQELQMRRMDAQGAGLVQQLGSAEKMFGVMRHAGISLEKEREVLRRQLGREQGTSQKMLRETQSMRRAGRTLQQQLGREQGITQSMQREMEGMQRAGRSLEDQRATLQQQLGREQGTSQKMLRETQSLRREGRQLQSDFDKAKMGHKMDLTLRDIDYADLKKTANQRIQGLEKRLNDGSADREAAQKEIDELKKALDAARRKPEAKQDRDGLKELRDDLAGLRKSIKDMPRQTAAPAAAPPIVVQGGAGGGGASSSAGGSSASSGGSGGGAAPARAPAPDMSKIVEAVKGLAAGAAKKKGAGGAGGAKGITRARRTYTDKRKAKIAELRALKSKRIREFAAKTKKLPKEARNKQRRAYKKRVEAQFKEMQTRFPTARGLKSVTVIRELIRKIDSIRSAK